MFSVMKWPFRKEERERKKRVQRIWWTGGTKGRNGNGQRKFRRWAEEHLQGSEKGGSFPFEESMFLCWG